MPPLTPVLKTNTMTVPDCCEPFELSNAQVSDMQKSLEGTFRSEMTFKSHTCFVLKYHMHTYHRETCYAPKAGGETYGSIVIFTQKKGWTMHAPGESWKSKCASITLSHDENPRELQAMQSRHASQL